MKMTEKTLGSDNIATSITVIDSQAPWFPGSACICLEFLIDGSKTIQNRPLIRSGSGPGSTSRFHVSKQSPAPFCGYELRLQRLDV